MNIRQDVGTARFHALLALLAVTGAAGTAIFLDGWGWGILSGLLALHAVCSAAAAVGAVRRDAGDIAGLGFCPSCGEELDEA